MGVGFLVRSLNRLSRSLRRSKTVCKMVLISPGFLMLDDLGGRFEERSLLPFLQVPEPRVTGLVLLMLDITGIFRVVAIVNTHDSK